jgi:hypothetical protein
VFYSHNSLLATIQFQRPDLAVNAILPDLAKSDILGDPADPAAYSLFCEPISLSPPVRQADADGTFILSLIFILSFL